MLLQFFAKQRVQRAHQEKRDDYSYEDQVTHTLSVIMSAT